MQPAKPRRMLAAKHRVITLAMILVTPGTLPKLLIVRGHHPTFAAGGQDLVLTERECRHVSQGAYGFAFIGGAMGLGAIFDNFQTMLFRQFKNRIHVARPAG